MPVSVILERIADGQSRDALLERLSGANEGR
ncbi:MAG: hypothetical protein ACLQVJ_05675 [Syntrophobacteraceae bacterium]